MREPSATPPARPTRWIVVVGLVVLFWALKAAHTVFVPIAAGAFLVALVHPLYRRVGEKTHKTVGVGVAFLTVVAGFAAFFSLVGWALETIASTLPEYEQQFVDAYDALQSTLQSFGFSLPEPKEIIGQQDSGMVARLAGVVGGQLEAFLTAFFLVLAFVALGIPEAGRYGHTLQRVGGLAEAVRATAREAGHAFRAYLGAVSISAAITAVLTAAFGYLVGLEFALVFALLSFLMNYVPTIGSVIAVIPPTLFALVQFDGLTMPLAVFAGFTVIELTVGNYVAPLIEGRILSISPVVVLAAIVFWGWLWGVVGALLAVPLTLAIALFCKRFETTRWVSEVIRNEGADPGRDEAESAPSGAAGG